MSINDLTLKISLDGFHVMRLSEDPIFNQKSYDFKPVETQMKEINLDNQSLFDDKGFGLFILTDGAKNRMLKIHDAFKSKFPVLLEGPTGTSKTRSVQILSNLMGKPLIRFNLSSETTTEDLLGRLVSDKDSWGCFSFKEGPFIDAFVNGKWLLLDEINLAPQSILQCMEAALDSHEIYLEIPGRDIIRYKEHDEFRIIATQNPNDGRFMMKRENLASKFLSKFTSVEFPEIPSDELYEIAKKQAELYDFKNDDFIKDLIQFHHEWSHRDDVKNSAHCFTIREITATIQAIQYHKNPGDAIMTFYGIRYPMKMREIMFRLINEKYQHLLSSPIKYSIPESFPKCFKSKSLKTTLKYINLAFQSQRHVLLVGKEGSGLTQIARWVAKYYSSTDIKDKNHDFCFICTPETTISDWIGRMIPVPKTDVGTDLIIWKDGPLTKAVKKGMCGVLDSLDFAPAKVSEKLNGLLDPKIMEGDMKFDILENPKENQIDINPKFRLIATCNEDNLDSISPALLNRFNVVYLDDQLFELEDDEKERLISFLFFQEIDESIRSSIPSDIIKKLMNSLNTDDYNMSHFSLICKATARIMPYCEGIDSTLIINFIKDLLDSECQDFQIPEKLRENLLKEFTSEQSENEEPFYYENSETLKDLMAKIMACSITGIHICLVGATGLGKTSMAVAFSEKTSESQGRGSHPYQLFSFNMESQVDDIYGTFSIDKGMPKISKGPLYLAMEKGQVFVADEFNLAEDTTIQSLAVALENSSGLKTLIPGLGKSIKFHKKFLFIACQNDIKTAGRKMLPPNIAKKLRMFEYPSPTLNDLITNCRIISKSELLYSDDSISLYDAERMATFINEINKSKIPFISKWSMRDVRKLFRRISDSLINPRKYLNFSIVYHIIFFIMSAIPEEVSKQIFDEIMKLITKCFGISPEENKRIEECYYMHPTRKDVDGIVYLQKGDIAVQVPKYITELKIFGEINLHSLWNTLFKILITHYKEPILISGNSGFKTFLASLVLPSTPIIALHQDTNISQLLGSIVLLNSKRSKEFYLEQFCKILHIKAEYPSLLLMLNEKMDIPSTTTSFDTDDDVKVDAKLTKLISDSDSDGSLNFSDDDDDDDVNDEKKTAVPKDKTDNTEENHLARFGKYLHSILEKNFSKNTTPESFRRILERLIDHIQEAIDSDDNYGLSDFTTVFKPGLFTSAVLEQYPLILKDLPNLTPAVFERFNQLNSNNPSLTLNEDICGTFTSTNGRNLNHFTNNFRIISLSSSDSVRNLSEAALSRITLITCSGYSETERNDAIASISLSMQQSLKPATYLEKFSNKYHSKFDKNLSFPYLTKILQMIHLMEGERKLTLEEKMYMVIYRIICGPMKDPSNKIKILEILDDIFGKETNKNYRALADNSYIEKSPFNYKDEGTSNTIFSEISKLSISCNEINRVESNLSFVTPFIDMIDSIFTGLSIHYPIILEGISGKGKHTAIQYVADTLGYKVVKFGISSATTSEDLFCKTIPTRKNGKLEFIFTPSQILNLINSETSDEKTIIVLEEINQASSALLDSISPLFDSSKSTILLPNGDIVQKGNYNIIALYDPSSQTTISSGLPASFRINSIYHTIPQYSFEQINKIAMKIFKDKDKFTEDHKSFMNYFHSMSKFQPKSSVPELYTLNDIKKYKLFTEGPLKDLESFVVENMILLYKYSEKEDIDDALKLLKIDIAELWPKFYIENNQFCASLTSKKAKTLSIDIDKDSIEESKYLYQIINSLTLLQRNCLLFLMCSVLSRQAAIISGPTASGKSYIVRYFAQLLGKKMITIQVNNDTGISTLTGQFAPSSSLSSDDIDEISQCFNNLCTENDLKNEIEKILDINDTKTWSPVKLKSIEDIVVDSPYKTKFSNETNILRSKRSFLSHLRQEDSAFIKAMQNGEWVLVDGIEAAPKELFEKIIPLCSNDPILNLYERGPEYIYSRNAEDEFKIHDDFRLFITYNPNDIEPSRRLSPSILNKFVTFVLQPIDITSIMSGIVLHGLTSKDMDEDLAIEISSRLANVHEHAKNYSYKDPKLFAAFNKFTGRSLLFNINIINTYFLDTSPECIAKILHQCLVLNYCNSHKEPKKFYEILLKELLKEPKLDLIQAMKKDVDSSNEKYKNILMDLYNLQMNKMDSDFSLKKFYDKIFQFELSDVDQLLFHIVDTLNQMDSIELINKFGSLLILVQFLNHLYESSQMPGIKSAEYKAKIDDNILLKNKRTTHSISQISFIKFLIEKDLLIEFTPLCLYSPSSRNIITEISELLIDLDFHKLFKIVSKILLTPSIYHDAETILNCDKIRESTFSNVLKLLPLFIQLQQNQIPFSINHQNLLVTFVECDYSVEFSISESNFELNEESQILCQFNSIKIDPSKFYSAVFYLINCLKNDTCPNFEKEYPSIQYPIIKNNNHPLFNMFPNENQSRILMILKAAFLLERPINVDLSILFGQFEVDLIVLFNTIWNILISKEYKSAINLIGVFMDIEKVSPNIFTIMNNDLDSLKNMKTDIKSIGDEIVHVIALLKSINMKFNQLREDYKGVETNSILPNTLTKWISELEDKKMNIQLDKLNEQFRKDAQDIKEQRNILLMKLHDAAKTASYENTHVLEQFIHYLEKMEITPATFEFLKRTIGQTKLNIERMISLIEKSETSPIEKVGNIPFPRKTKIENEKYRDNIHRKICTIFLEYSETIKLLRNIQENIDPMSSLYELSRKKDLELEELPQFLCSSSDEPDNSQKELLINKVKSYAGALTIKQLCSLKDDGYELLVHPEKLKAEFEKFNNRNEYDEYLEYWAGKLSLKYDPKDMIIIPKYTPSDLHPLFVLQNFDDHSIFESSSDKPGILLKETIHPSIELVKQLGKIDLSKYDGLQEYLNEVSRIALNVLRDKIVESDFEDAVREENERIENEVFTIILHLYPICMAQDSREPFDFSVDDLFFVKSNWLSNVEMCAKYPSLTYWLIENSECQRKLRFYFVDLKVEPDSLPLFLHILRIFSSINCISFKSSSQGDSSNKISKIIINYLIPKLMHNESHIMEWINLLLPNIPIDFYNLEISLIYDFLNSLSQNPNTLKSEISKQCQDELYKIIIEQMIDSIFERKVHQYFTNELNDHFSEFIKNPYEAMKNKIDDTFSSMKQKEFETMKKDLDIISNALKKIRDSKEPLIKAIKDDGENACAVKLNEEKTKKLNVHDDIFNEFQSNVSTYQTVYDKIFNNDLDENNSIVSSDIKKMHLSKNYFDKKEYDVFDKSKQIYIFAVVKPEAYSEKSYNYINPKLYDVNDNDSLDLANSDVRKKLKKLSKSDSPKICTLIFRPLLKDSISELSKKFDKEREHIIDVITSSTLDKEKFTPKMQFCGNFAITEKTYPAIIQSIFENCNSFLSDLDSKTVSKNLFEIFQAKINKVSIDIGKVKEIKSSKFYELKNLKAEETSNIIFHEIKPSLELLDHYFTKFKKIVNKIITLDMDIKTDIKKSLFSLEYTLPVLNVDIKKKAEIWPVSMDKINQSNLATPFISVTPSHEIICCIKPFNPVIGPIIPDLYESKQISIKILSFVSQEIHSQILMEDDDSIFSTVPMVQAFNPITISLTVPKYNDNISKEITYSGNMQISSKDLVSCEIPCNFTLQFLPLNILIHSPKFPLSYSNDVFHICCNKITPKEEIKIKLTIPHYDQNYNFVISKKSFSDNQAEDPFCSMEENNILTIQMPQTPAFIHGLITINIIPNVFVPFEIKADIMHNRVFFKIFDHFKKEFIDDALNVYIQPNSVAKYYCYIDTNFVVSPHDVQRLSSNSPNISITFGEIKLSKRSLIYFDIDINMNSNSASHDFSNISILVNGIEKRIKIHFYKSNITLEKKKVYNSWITSYDYSFSRTINDHYAFNYSNKVFSNIKSIDKRIIENYWKDVNPIIVMNPFDIIILPNPDFKVSSNRVIFDELDKIDHYLLKDTYYCRIGYTNKIDLSNNYFSNMLPIILGYTYYKKTSYYISTKTYYKWFPFCREYINEFESLDLYSNRKEKIKQAKENLLIFLNQLCSKLPFKIEKLSLEEACQTILKNIEKIPVTNFAPVAAKIAQGKFNLDSLKSLPNDILQDFQIRDPPKNMKENEMIIYWHNLIMLIYSVCHKRYNELKKYNFYLFLDIKWDDIIKAQSRIFDISKPFDAFEEKARLIKKADISSPNISTGSDVHSKSWIIRRNTKPEPNPKYDIENDIKIFEHHSNSISYESVSLINDVTHSLEIPDLSSMKSMEQMIDAYMKLTNLSQSLPFFIYILKQKSESLAKVNECFNFLAQAYFQSSTHKLSFLKHHIKSFTNSFEHLCTRLSQSGLKFNGPKKDFFKFNQFKQSIQDYIEIPDPILPPPSINLWSVNQFKPKLRQYDELSNKLFESSHEPTNIKIKSENKKSEAKPINRVKEIAQANVKISPAYVKMDEIESISGKDEGKKIIIPMEPHETSDGPLIPVPPEKLEVVRSGFKGEDMINGIVKRIKDFELKGTLPLPVEYAKKPPADILNQKYGVDDGSEEVPIRKMIELTDHLSSVFIQNCIDSECSLSNTCAVILIECSQTLSRENKLSCVMLATSFAKAFNAIEMPYSVVVFADYKFQFEIKKFDENHSDDVIQKILDCVMVERFAPRIADACYFGKETLICANRSNRAFFIISDGLDPYMNYTDDWKKYILNDNQNSFGFFILRSAYLNDSQYEIVSKMWNNFNVSVNGADSLTRYYEFTSDSVFNGEVKISISLLLEPFKNSSKDDKKHEFKYPVEYREGINKISIDHVESYINRYYNDKIDSIFIKDDDIIEQSKGIIFPSFQITSNYLVNCKTDTDDKKLNDLNQDIINHQKAANEQWKEVIFSPNKPSQMAPSIKGTKLYIQGLIKFCLTDGQENKIWLEKIAGLKRNYRVSVVIDASNSCFNELMYPHSLQTVITFLRTLATIEIPYFDLIVATAEGPEIIAVNQNTQTCLDPHGSDLWASLFSTFERHDNKCNLYDAILCAMKLKSTIVAKKSFLFVFTDGLYDENEQESLKNVLIACREFSISVYGIGIGLYPKRIEKIFQKCVWSINPTYIITAISKFFGNETPGNLKEIKLFGPAYPEFEKIKELTSKICEKHPGTIVYKSLFKYLNDQALYKESCPDYQAEASGINDGSLVVNPTFSDDSTMYKKNAFEGQKILICCYWSKSIAGEDESDWVDPVYLTSQYNKNKCVADIISYYGIGVEVAINYRKAIAELQTGQYYAAWIICGDNNENLPDEKATKSGEAYFVDQFIECVERFWKSGGSVVWWCDNDPLFFQANKFLEIAEFPGEVRKTNLRLVKGSEGMKYIKAGNITTNKKGIFDNQRELNFGKFIRPSVAHNLVSLYEGQTISRANNPNDIAPFRPFAYDSEGGLISLYFASTADDKCGDVFIDTGFTKLFNELKFSGNDGTQRYVQNIAAFTAQYQKHLRDLGENGPRIYRPVKFSFTIDESRKSNSVTKAMDPSFDIIYMVDATGSMSSHINAAKEQCINISNELKVKLPKFEFQFGAIFYRDPVDSPSDIMNTFLLSTDVNSLRNDIGKVCANGGGDGPEDWVGAYRAALDQINWRKGIRLIIHIADAPAHGHSYCGTQNHEEENGKLAPLLKNCASSGIKIVGMPIGGNYSLNSFNQCRADYNTGSHKQMFYEIQPFNVGSSDLSSYFKDAVVHAAVCAAPRS
ncbi:hypothetical protein M9Y10_041465 [Tritrichomonas musculus]|uniref:VWFA domain-containing protein n=1 Tax=Tritrichomonas musculus TaxID=1915356 RepID=A0ABR2K505_9EUKA